MSLTPYTSTAAGIAREVNAGKLAPKDVASFYVARTKQHAETLHTHLHFDEHHVAAQVAELEKRLKNGERPALAGVPVVLKDNICVAGVPTTCASKILQAYRPPYDAHVVTKLRAAGAILFGKANMDEFAMGSSTENSAYGPTKNPWDLARVPGGSSGGSAASVAADLAPVALGSDTGGSVRQPAALCGIVGLKPTYGRVSRYGLVAYGSSLDQIGPLARSVEDAALLLDVIGGNDPRDSTSKDLPATNALKGLQGDIKGLRVGVIKELMAEGLDAGTRSAVTAALETFKSLGATIREVSLPYLKYSPAAYYLIAPAEASSNLARFDGVRYGYRHKQPGQSLKEMYARTRSEGFGREVKQRIMLGTFALSSGYYDAYYAKANRARQLIRGDFERAFKDVDLLASPAYPTTAFKLGEKNADPLALYLSDICTLAANLAGVPGVSVPCGVDAQGLPVGLQLMAPHFAEETLLKGAWRFEQAVRFHDQHRPRLA